MVAVFLGIETVVFIQILYVIVVNISVKMSIAGTWEINI